MSKVTEVLTALRTEVADVLGSDWSRMAYVYNPSKNDFRAGDMGYGVRALDAVEDNLINKQIDVIHTFEVLLSRYFLNRSNDENIEDVISELQDRTQDIYKRVLYTKLGGRILLASALSIAEPEIIEDNEVIVQRFSFDVRYRIKL